MFSDLFGSYQRMAIAAGLAILAAAVGGWLWQKRGAPPGGAALPPLVSPVSSPTSELAPLVLPPGRSPVPSYTGVPVGVLQADPVFLPQVPPAVYEQSTQELADLARKLAADPGQPHLWMRVAHIKHFYNDDIGAADAYEYLNIIAEGDGLPYYNLALIYGYYLKEPDKAIPKFESAIRRHVTNASYYVGYSDFYREVRRDLDSAERVLLQGLAKVPTDIGIMGRLGWLYRERGDVAKALEYFEQILARPDLGAGERAALAAQVEKLKAAR